MGFRKVWLGHWSVRVKCDLHGGGGLHQHETQLVSVRPLLERWEGGTVRREVGPGTGTEMSGQAGWAPALQC